MILDSIIQRPEHIFKNVWVDFILKHKDRNIFARLYKKYKLNKLKSRVPDISFMYEIAQTVQYLGKYFFYYNNKEFSPIASYKSKDMDVIIINLGEKYWRLIFELKNNNVHMIIENSSTLFDKKWNNDSINTIIENKYEEYTFNKASEILMDRFIELIKSYL